MYRARVCVVLVLVATSSSYESYVRKSCKCRCTDTIDAPIYPGHRSGRFTRLGYLLERESLRRSWGEPLAERPCCEIALLYIMHASAGADILTVSGSELQKDEVDTMADTSAKHTEIEEKASNVTV
eukprot:scaffold488615_cov19-Prasinocladus_malaysianus.AAC.2